jgi:hypothetical protein
VRGGRVAIAAVSAALFGLVCAGSAQACSCAPSSPAQSLAAADAAIAGRLLSVDPRGAVHAAYRYEVLRVYRGGDRIEPGSVLTVISPRGSASCGLPQRLGRAYGLFLLGQGRHWASGLCGVISPRRLRAAAQRPGAGTARRPPPPGCTS